MTLVRHRSDRLQAETGLSLVQQGSTPGATDNFISTRGAATYVHNFTETTYLRQTVEATANLENANDFRVTSESAVVAPCLGASRSRSATSCDSTICRSRDSTPPTGC